MARAVSLAEDAIKQALGQGAKFILVELDQGATKPVYDDDGQLVYFTSGQRASGEASRLSEKLGRKVQPRLINDDKWRQREESRMNGGYLSLPWSKERWWVDLKDIWQDHYPHASVAKEAFLAFTESPEKGAADIQTRIKPGKYLEKYFGTPGILNDYVIRHLCTQFSNTYEINIIHYATTPDEIEHVYTRGPASCMSHPTSQYKTPEHPTRMYAAGDLQVAYLKRDDRVVARTIVWPDKKWYNGGYGDMARLRPLLEKEGFKNRAPLGARLRKVKHTRPDWDKGLYCFVVPHVDNVGHVHEDGEFLRIGEGGKRSLSFSGGHGITEQVGWACYTCGDSVKNGENRSHVDNRSAMALFCNKCAKAHTFRCEFTGDRVWVDESTTAMCVDAKDSEHRVWKRWAGEYFFLCKDDGRYRVMSESAPVYEGKSMTYYSQAWAKANAKICRDCGRWTMGECSVCPSLKKSKTSTSSAHTITIGTPTSSWR